MPAALRLSLLIVVVLVARGQTQELEYTAEERGHWSLQPRRLVAVPALTDSQLRRQQANSVDAFVFSKLQQQGLRPSPRADRRTFIRRVTFGLTGLPPTPAEIHAYVRDPSLDADAKLVDRLLASPRYGEHWGQHWLDVVRYAETEGFEYDRYRPGAWRFRDYVIRSFNLDKPYDRFVREQLAGDELDPRDGELLVAAGFHRLGPVRRNAGNPEVAFSRNEVLTERTDIIGVAFLGLTVGCARCHDHMYDPIRQKDYYRLQAFLASSFEHNHPLGSSDEQRHWQRQADRIDKRVLQIKQALSAANGSEELRLQQELRETESRRPRPLPTISTVRNRNQDRTPVRLLERGDTERPGELLEPRVLGVLLPEGTTPFSVDVGDPRTKLAAWLSRADHPLTARVLVNRIWKYHFGVGLVATPNDFGVNGSLPSHPSLLDHLANEFVRGGWSIKQLHRLILLSATYRQSSRSEMAEQASAVDPDNRLLWRYRRRRLMAHELRDAMLSASGMLDSRMGGPSIMLPVDQELVGLLYKPTQWQVAARTADHYRRTVYLIAKRNLRLPFLEIFDQPDLQTSCGQRECSTHAPQALEMLNGRLANSLAGALAARLQTEAGEEATRQVQLAFALVAGRRPTADEQELAVKFLETQTLEEFGLGMFNLNAFLYVD